MNLDKVGQGHRIAGGAALLLLIDLWLSWYRVNGDLVDAAGGTGGFDTSFSAWQSFDFADMLLFVTVVMALVMVAQAAGAVRLPVRLSDVVLPLAALATLVVLYRIVDQPGQNEGLDVAFGAFLGLILTALITYGAYRARGEHEATGQAEVAGKPLAVETRPGAGVGGERPRPVEPVQEHDPPPISNQPAVPVPPPAVPAANDAYDDDEGVAKPPPPSTGP